jgi:hypothetical protein
VRHDRRRGRGSGRHDDRQEARATAAATSAAGSQHQDRTGHGAAAHLKTHSTGKHQCPLVLLMGEETRTSLHLVQSMEISFILLIFVIYLFFCHR